MIPHSFDEGANLVGIFFAGAGFNPGGNIHTPGLKD